MRRFAIAAAMALCITNIDAVQAQDTFALDFRGGVALPAEDLGDTSLNTGFGLGVTASYRIQPHLRIYGGWDWTHFVTDDDAEFDVEPNGYAFGLQFQHPFSNSMWGWVRAGGLYNHIEVEDGDGSVFDSGHELGWEVGGGVRLPLGQRLALTPGVRYRAFSADFDVAAAPASVDMSFFSAEMGISWSFGAGSLTSARK